MFHDYMHILKLCFNIHVLIEYLLFTQNSDETALYAMAIYNMSVGQTTIGQYAVQRNN